MIDCALAARWVGVHRVDSVAAGGGAIGECVFVYIHLQVIWGWLVGIALSVFQRPLVLGRIHLAKIVDANVFLRRVARPNEVRDGNGHQQTDDGHHDHDFHKREALFGQGFDFHVTALSVVRREPGGRRA